MSLYLDLVHGVGVLEQIRRPYTGSWAQPAGLLTPGPHSGLSPQSIVSTFSPFSRGVSSTPQELWTGPAALGKEEGSCK